MLTLRKKLEMHAKKTGRRLDVLQQDYLLSWVLWGIYQHAQLRSSLIFKGGTALKKCYFGDYRFSEDLDFSLSEDREPKSLFAAIIDVAKKTEEKISDFAPIRLSVDEYKENKPHPFGQEAFQMRAQFPWQRAPLTVVMIEISRDELLVLPPASRTLIHEYGETIEQQIGVYSLEEIILEKLRAILQHTKKLHERDWNRSRARDFYDLWSIFKNFHDQLNLQNLPELLTKKCLHKGVAFNDADSFFNDKILTNVSHTWESWLGPLVSNLPAYQTVISELRPHIVALLSTATVQ